ncbi:hypothetical protein TcasGA2_TC011897 [Tribolium castaneum]|uniref:Uncharacterized protein n=1 Tax=Tribolium castaneum TaxID=7070 RepID=D6WZ54_TRICA|nr:hypothetical protein TcasGA2_TC011897 [Tribolium castaneum]
MSDKKGSRGDVIVQSWVFGSGLVLGLGSDVSKLTSDWCKVFDGTAGFNRVRVIDRGFQQGWCTAEKGRGRRFRHFSAADPFAYFLRCSTDREVSSVERVDDERLVAQVDDAADAVARVEGGRGSGVVLDGPVVVAMFDILSKDGNS